MNSEVSFIFTHKNTLGNVFNLNIGKLYRMCHLNSSIIKILSTNNTISEMPAGWLNIGQIMKCLRLIKRKKPDSI